MQACSRVQVGCGCGGQLVSHLLGDEAVVVDVHVHQPGKDFRLVRAHLHHHTAEDRQFELARSVKVPRREERPDLGALACVQSDYHRAVRHRIAFRRLFAAVLCTAPPLTNTK